MSFVDIADLHPLYVHVHERLGIGARLADPPPQPIACPVAEVIYRALHVDGEMRNGGVAQLIWNLHDSVAASVFGDALRTIGATEGAEIVEQGFAYVAETPTRKERFFAKGPFGPAKPLMRLSDRYDDLVPDVASLLGRYVVEQWETPSFAAVRDSCGLDDVRTGAGEITEEMVDRAVDSADADRIVGFIEAGYDANAVDDRGRNLLARIVRRSDKVGARCEMLRALVAAGVDVHAVDAKSETIMNRAVSFGGQPEYLRVLIDLGAEIDHRGVNGWTPLHRAIKNSASTKVLLDAGARVDVLDDYGITPLGAAIAEFESKRDPNPSEALAAIGLLIEHGAPLSSTAAVRRRPLRFETELCNAVADASLLGRLVALPSFEDSPEMRSGGPTDDPASGPWTALHEASSLGLADAVAVLLDAGMDPNVEMSIGSIGRERWAGTRPLDVATDTTAPLLVDAGAEPGQRRHYEVHIVALPQDINAVDEPAGASGLRNLFMAHGVSDLAATETVAALPPQPGVTTDWDANDDLVMFEPAVLDRVDVEATARTLADAAEAFGALVVIL